MCPASDHYFSYQQRIDALRATKQRYTQEKWNVIGSMDFDDHALILPPPESRHIVNVISGSGVPITDVLLKEFQPKSNHPSGGFFGPEACGENFKALLMAHPVYIDPMSSLAGGYMVNFLSYRDPFWNPDFDYSHLHEQQQRYKLYHGIGAVQHFCQDLQIGFDLGWAGILEKIHRFRAINTGTEAGAFYDGLEAVVQGMQNWIGRTAKAAREMSVAESHPQLRQNLVELADMNERLVNHSPATFRDACQWMLWYQMAGKMYNMSGSLGKIDQLLFPFYERDKAADMLSDEEAIFHLACHLIQDTSYMQLGGPDASGQDKTNHLSLLVLEAAHRLKIPANIGVCVGESIDAQLLQRGLEIMLADKTGIPKFLGIENTIKGFERNGYPPELARQRAYSGCHWSALPGREYTVNDCVKVNFARIFEVAFEDILGDPETTPSVNELWRRFEHHLGAALDVIRESLDFQLEHMHQVFPELVLDLLCHGPIERGLDASHGGVEYINLGIDGAGLATTADSFAAVEQRVEKEQRLTWKELKRLLDTDWQSPEGERMRLMMKSIPRYGSGDSRADDYGIRIARTFSRLVKEKPTPNGYNLIPGIFSWAATILMGKDVGATPNGRRVGEAISHGPNPDPGFRKDGAPTALATITAAVQQKFGNASPMQIELDPGFAREDDAIAYTGHLVKTHFSLGGTQINMNILNKQKILEAHQDPGKYPDLIVRVTGFSAYFGSLSKEFRQLVVDRILAE
ncbi:formate acetyltransferase [candidate division KSB1 bacterium]|nr:formate acetyltransferase [candidate division KSB1 bacterium]